LPTIRELAARTSENYTVNPLLHILGSSNSTYRLSFAEETLRSPISHANRQSTHLGTPRQIEFDLLVTF